MKIIRDNVEIELTAQELSQAYWEQEQLYRIQDAERHFINHIADSNCVDDLEKLSCEEADDVRARFESFYGFTVADAITAGSDNYLLDTIAHGFANALDCNCSENDLYDSIVSGVLQEVREGKE